MILRIIYCFLKGNIVEAAIWYGVVVHFRIYPIIYVVAFLIALGNRSSIFATKSRQSSHVEETDHLRKWQLTSIRFFMDLLYLNKERIIFGVVSGTVFFFLTGISYSLYKDKFLYEALLYHLTRTDPRHNFSIYFYYIYLHHGYSFTLVERLISFIPQFLVQSVLTAYYAKDIPFCLFIQTVAFVAFNKVITAQYFVWFFVLMPLILPWTRLAPLKGFMCFLLWSAAQLHWLLWAYKLEFQGYNVFFQLWIASLAFFLVNIFVLSVIIWHHSSPYITSKVPLPLGETKNTKIH
ncbi:hypothetical protein KP509_34G002400 [Ceratopteris richardii]|nr:hypothetical protein KP509_34G002400 [Ceratopteris richardii]